MFLYNLTLQRATGISFAIHGNFSGNCLFPSRFLGSRGKKGIEFLLVSFFIGLLKLCCFGGAFFFFAGVLLLLALDLQLLGRSKKYGLLTCGFNLVFCPLLQSVERCWSNSSTQSGE